MGAKVTGVFGDVVAKLTFDEEFLEKRQRQQSSFGQGLESLSKVSRHFLKILLVIMLIIMSFIVRVCSMVLLEWLHNLSKEQKRKGYLGSLRAQVKGSLAWY